MQKKLTKAQLQRLDRMYKGQPVIIGVDQSYTRTGISIVVNGKLKKVTSINFKCVKTKTEKRLLLSRKIEQAIQSCLKHYPPSEICVVCERIRTFTSGFDIRPDYLKTTGALIASFVDTAYKYNIYTYSIDTRAWKAAVLGSSKPTGEPIEGVTNPQKFASVRYVINLGFEKELQKIQGRGGKSHITLDDDAADSACIALSPFYANKDKFQREY